MSEGGAVGGGFRTWVPDVITGVPAPLPHPPQDTRGTREGRGEESRGLKLTSRRYPATQGRRIAAAKAVYRQFDREHIQKTAMFCFF